MKTFWALFEDTTVEKIEAENVEDAFREAYVSHKDKTLLAVMHDEKLAKELASVMLKEVSWQ